MKQIHTILIQFKIYKKMFINLKNLKMDAYTSQEWPQPYNFGGTEKPD